MDGGTWHNVENSSVDAQVWVTNPLSRQKQMFQPSAVDASRICMTYLLWLNPRYYIWFCHWQMWWEILSPTNMYCSSPSDNSKTMAQELKPIMILFGWLFQILIQGHYKLISNKLNSNTLLWTIFYLIYFCYIKKSQKPQKVARLLYHRNPVAHHAVCMRLVEDWASRWFVETWEEFKHLVMLGP